MEVFPKMIYAKNNRILDMNQWGYEYIFAEISNQNLRRVSKRWTEYSPFKKWSVIEWFGRSLPREYSDELRHTPIYREALMIYCECPVDYATKIILCDNSLQQSSKMRSWRRKEEEAPVGIVLCMFSRILYMWNICEI